MDLFSLDNINIDALQPLLYIFPDGWFDDVRLLYGESLSDEMISQSVEETCDFFHIDEPATVSEGWTTGVYPNNDFTLQDDVLIFNREQLLDMGISGKDGLDLVMTHEGTHRVLQGMENLEFDSHQEELCCDYMAGVRAGLNGIDVSQMENSLMYTPESEKHPAGVERVESIEAGVRFAQQYYAEYNMAPTFNECLDNFCEINEVEQSEQITLREENATSDFNAYHSSESTGGVAIVDSEIDGSNPSFKGYTQDEINRKAAEAAEEQRYHEAEARHHLSMAKNGLSKANTEYHISEAEIHQNRANDFKSEYNKWRNMKPDKK